MVRGLLNFTACLLFLVYDASACEVIAQTKSGRVCGRILGQRLAVFRGLPYAEQPVGERRFQELQRLKPWKGILNATVQGPVCPQVDRLFGPLIKPLGMSEACIYANVHAPVTALLSEDEDGTTCSAGLPVLVFIHGGGWESGSGDPDFYGPEYFVDRDVVMITFNYRQNIFGFMSLNTTDVPGNQGLRDIVTLLQWVRENVHFFGGNPDDVTIMGQSCGAVSALLIALSPVTKGLFMRVILSSGNALPSLYTPLPAYSQYVTALLLSELGIEDTDPNIIFQKLIELPIDTLLAANDVVQNQTGLIAFAAVRESRFPGVTTIIDEDPTVLIQNGALNDIPFLIGFTTSEVSTFQRRIEGLNFIDLLQANPTLLLSPKLLYTVDNETALELAAKVQKYYFDGEITFDEYVTQASDALFVYPTLKLAQIRAATGSSNTYLYQFGYEGEFRTAVEALQPDPFEGVGHVEDLNYIFRSNALLDEYPPQNTPTDDLMKTAWVDTIINFMTCSRPICGKDAQKWPAVSKKALVYQDIRGPGDFRSTSLTESQRQIMDLYDGIEMLL